MGVYKLGVKTLLQGGKWNCNNKPGQVKGYKRGELLPPGRCLAIPGAAFPMWSQLAGRPKCQLEEGYMSRQGKLYLDRSGSPVVFFLDEVHDMWPDEELAVTIYWS